MGSVFMTVAPQREGQLWHSLFRLAKYRIIEMLAELSQTVSTMTASTRVDVAATKQDL